MGVGFLIMMNWSMVVGRAEFGIVSNVQFVF